MSKVTRFFPKDSYKDPDLVLEKAKGMFEDVLVIGWTKEEGLMGFVASEKFLRAKECLVITSIFKHLVLDDMLYPFEEE